MINHYYPLNNQSNLLRPASNIQYVQGEAGAKGFYVDKSYTMLLMDSEEQKFYIKSVDATGIPKMKKYRFEEIIEPESEKIEYITKKDFEDFKKEIKDILNSPKKTKAGETDG